MRLIDKLPYFYGECPKTNTIQEGLGAETNNLYSKVEGTTNQLYVSSSTWALGEWEKFAGVKKTDGSIEQRRARVIAKLKAKGTTTLEVLEAVCNIYASKVEIEEIYNEYALMISLAEEKDSFNPIEYRLNDMNEAIWEVKPAHLNHYFKFSQSRKLGIQTNYEDVTIKYIPCNSCYAGQFQPNTYNYDKELCNLGDSYANISTPNEKPPTNTAMLGVAILGEAILGGVK